MSEERRAKPDWLAEIRRRRLFRAMAAYLVGAWLLLHRLEHDVAATATSSE